MLRIPLRNSTIFVGSTPPNGAFDEFDTKKNQNSKFENRFSESV
jgi:hypothetical protein